MFAIVDGKINVPVPFVPIIPFTVASMMVGFAKFASTTVTVSQTVGAPIGFTTAGILPAL